MAASLRNLRIMRRHAGLAGRGKEPTGYRANSNPACLRVRYRSRPGATRVRQGKNQASTQEGLPGVRGAGNLRANCLKCVAQVQAELSGIGGCLCDCLLQVCGCQVVCAQVCLHVRNAFVCVVQAVVKLVDLLRRVPVDATDLCLQLFEIAFEVCHATQNVALIVLHYVHGSFQAMYCGENVCQCPVVQC